MNWYDYEARHKDDWRFTTVDPMAEKYYSISPYAYCSNNPINKIDPDGCDEWELNEEGRLVKRIENQIITGFYIVDSDGNRIKDRFIEFDYTNVKHSKGMDNYGGHFSYESYEMQGDENGTKVFEFMAQNFGVPRKQGGVPEVFGETMEWSIVRVGSKGDYGINYISTSFNARKESYGTMLINKIQTNGLYIRELTHRHPDNGDQILEPSGIPGSIESYSQQGDIPVAAEITRRNKKVIPIFKVYSGYQKNYVKYNQNGIIK